MTEFFKLHSDNTSFFKLSNYMKNLSFYGYILAGHSVTNVINSVKLTGDLDFFANTEKSFLVAFNELFPFYKKFIIYPSMIEMIDDFHPRVNLIYNTSTFNNIVSNFDWDYCKCYWTPKLGLFSTFNCIASIKTKKLTIDDIFVKKYNNARIYKAIKYGYSFNGSFLRQKIEIFKYPIIFKKFLVNDKFYKLNVDELNEEKCSKTKLTCNYFNIKDVKNVKNTLKEIYKKISGKFKNNVLPILLTLENETSCLIKEYITKIIFKNPMVQFSTYYTLKFNKPLNMIDSDDEDYAIDSDDEDDIIDSDDVENKLIINETKNNIDSVNNNDEIINEIENYKTFKKITFKLLDLDKKELMKYILDSVNINKLKCDFED